jgi:hypothetical protein
VWDWSIVRHRSKKDNISKDNDDDSDRCNDVFDVTIDDLSQTNALQSSLWELHALERHYHPAVATMAQAIGRPDNSKLHYMIWTTLSSLPLKPCWNKNINMLLPNAKSKRIYRSRLLPPCHSFVTTSKSYCRPDPTSSRLLYGPARQTRNHHKKQYEILFSLKRRLSWTRRNKNVKIW